MTAREQAALDRLLLLVERAVRSRCLPALVARIRREDGADMARLARVYGEMYAEARR